MLPPLLVQVEVVEVVKVEVPQPLGSFCTLWPGLPWVQKFYCQVPVKLKIEVEELYIQKATIITKENGIQKQRSMKMRM